MNNIGLGLEHTLGLIDVSRELTDEIIAMAERDKRNAEDVSDTAKMCHEYLIKVLQMYQKKNVAENTVVKILTRIDKDDKKSKAKNGKHKVNKSK